MKKQDSASTPDNTPAHLLVSRNLELLRRIFHHGTEKQRNQAVKLAAYEAPRLANLQLEAILAGNSIPDALPKRKMPLPPKRVAEQVSLLRQVAAGKQSLAEISKLDEIVVTQAVRYLKESFQLTGEHATPRLWLQDCLTQFRTGHTDWQQQLLEWSVEGSRNALMPPSMLPGWVNNVAGASIRDAFTKQPPKRESGIFEFALGMAADDLIEILTKNYGFGLKTRYCLWHIGSMTSLQARQNIPVEQGTLNAMKKLFLQALEEGVDFYTIIDRPCVVWEDPRFRNTVLHTHLADILCEEAAMLIEAVKEYNQNHQPPLHLETPDRFGKTALQMAVLVGANDIAKNLVIAGAKVNTADIDGITPLHRACCLGNVEMVRFLLDSGAKFNARDSNGLTPLQYAGGNQKTVYAMLKSITIDPDKHYQARWSNPTRFIAPEDTIANRALANHQAIATLLREKGAELPAGWSDRVTIQGKGADKGI